MLTLCMRTSLQSLCQQSWTTCFNVLEKWIYSDRLIFSLNFNMVLWNWKCKGFVWFSHPTAKSSTWLSGFMSLPLQPGVESLNKNPAVKPRALICIFFLVPLWMAPHCYWGTHEHADRQPCKIYLAPVLFWVPKIYFYLRQPRPFPVREETTIIYVQMHHKWTENFIFLSLFPSCISKPISFRLRQDCTAALHWIGKKPQLMPWGKCKYQEGRICQGTLF